MSEPQIPAVEQNRCLAQEWQRDGRGLWAMRHCTYDAQHRGKSHFYGPWQYNVPDPMVAAKDAEIARLREERDTLDKHHESAENEVLRYHDREDKWRDEKARLQAEIARLTQERDVQKERADAERDSASDMARAMVQSAREIRSHEKKITDLQARLHAVEAAREQDRQPR